MIIPITMQNNGGAVPAGAYGLVTTIAGSTSGGLKDGNGTAALFNEPRKIAVDGNGNLYVADWGNSVIRKITPAGFVTTVLISGGDFNGPMGIAVDNAGNLYIADTGNNQIKKINSAGMVTVLAGSSLTGSTNGVGTSATFNYPTGIALDATGNVYVADYGNNLVRKITSAGVVSTFAGSGQPGSTDGIGTAASFNHPNDVAVDGTGNVYVADGGNNLIRKITISANVTTFAGNIHGNGSIDGLGTAASFGDPISLSADAKGILFVADGVTDAIRRIDPSGLVSTVAGGIQGSADGIGPSASFYGPSGVTIDFQGNIYVSDSFNNLIRKISIYGYIIDKPLPAGLTFDPNTGTISGTPTAVSPPTDYTVTAYNSTGSSSTTIRIEVDGIVPVITTSTVTGTILGCVGSPGESPNIGQFTVAGTGLTGDITVTPPAGFDLSLTAVGGYSLNLTLKQIGGAVISTTIYIRSSASDPIGPISGNMQVTTPGASPTPVAITGTVNALPTVNPVSNQTVNAGASTTAVNFSGTADTFTWTNDNPSIGLAASGTGNIAAFTATNTGNVPINANIIVTPASSASGCTGTPTTFTITVNSSSPFITTGTATGTITTCAGTPSASPNIGQFTVSGSSLTGDIRATAPEGFEISLAPDGGYSNEVVIPQSAGTIDNVTVYIRLSASDGGSVSGTVVSGKVILNSPGAQQQLVSVTGTVYVGPTMDQPASQTVAAGQATAPVNFTGAAGFYTWTNDTPGIGLPANGTGNIPSFTAINSGTGPVIATITVIPQSMSAVACNGTPVTFTITVSPTPPPVITSSGTLTGLSTIYGIASSSESFTVSATNTTAAILVTAPQGFEVSTDNQSFSAVVNIGSTGTVTNVPVYIRLAATTAAGRYAGNIVLSTSGATDVNMKIPLSIVERATLTVTAPNVTRAYGIQNPVFVPTYQGFVNGDDPSKLDLLPDLTTIATITSPPGQYPIHVSGGTSHNYTIIPVDGTLTITPDPTEINVPNAFTPNGDGVNDFWNIKQLTDFPQCIVSVYSRYGGLVFQSHGYAKPWDGTSNGSPVPSGTYYYIINPNLNGLPSLSGYVAVLR